MIDKPSATRISQLHPKVRAEVTKMFEEANSKLTGNAKLRITQGLRTIEEQDALYKQGRSKPGKVVTNARGGSSYHNYGLAFDICLILDGKTVSWESTKDYDGDNVADWMEAVAVFKKYGWAWGGNFKTITDKPHFEKNFGYSVSDLYKKFVSNVLETDPVTKIRYVKI